MKLEIRPIPQKFDMNTLTPKEITDVGNPRVEIEMRGELTTTMALEVANAIEKIMKKHGNHTKEIPQG